MQMQITIGEIDGNEISISRTNGQLCVHVTDGEHVAAYMRAAQGFVLQKSTYDANSNTQIYKSLMLNLSEIDRRNVELSEAETQIRYYPVLKTDGYSVQVGKSETQQIFIVVEKQGKRALLQYVNKSIIFISTTYNKEENGCVRNIVAQNMLTIVNSMRKYNLLSNKCGKTLHLYATDDNNVETGMTEAGLRERAKVDRQLTTMFKALETAGYSNLEIQAMMMESVLEIAMQSRLVAKQNKSVQNTQTTQTTQNVATKYVDTRVGQQKPCTNSSIRQVLPRNN